MNDAPVASAGMLIRKPVDEVFEAFVDPTITTRFWFSRGSGRLAPGAVVRWDWEMYGAGSDVRVKALEPDRRILIDWDLDAPTEVEWRFEARGKHTWVTVTNRGFHGEDPVAEALDSAGGFALVLAGAKIWLEHGIAPGFVEDRHPDHLKAEWTDR
ncbi:SRPBCC family protein [Brevundimonas sp. 2R-24]|uniref:SRPBCC family protein n=1 Tax=Peiella sedimenti TaxID=3061083 RepID=A0ABT8SM71_9CAUL|nr:SRPBCC family protein [Caulobacteraceae bacterium XZ-24]